MAETLTKQDILELFKVNEEKFNERLKKREKERERSRKEFDERLKKQELEREKSRKEFEERMRKLDGKFGNILLGAVAGMKIKQYADKYADKKGLFVLKQKGEIVEIANDESFQPREWDVK